MEYKKQYIWGSKNPALKVAYYLYDRGSRSMAVAENHFKDFFGNKFNSSKILHVIV
jgi:hypothetical protein